MPIPPSSRPIILCDNQPLTRDAVASYLSDHLIFLASEKGRLVTLLGRHPESVVVVDYALFDFSGPENVLILLRRFPQSSWVFLSSDFREPFLRLLGTEGQANFLTKNCSRQEVMEAVHAAEKREQHVCDSVAEQLRTGFPSTAADKLTVSETEVLSLLAQGLSSREIAEHRHRASTPSSRRRKTSSANWASAPPLKPPAMPSVPDWSIPSNITFEERKIGRRRWSRRFSPAGQR